MLKVVFCSRQLSFQKSIFRYLQPTKEIDQTFHLPWGFEDFVDRKILVERLSRNDDDRVSCANKIHDYSVPMISNVINSQRLWIIGQTYWTSILVKKNLWKQKVGIAKSTHAFSTSNGIIWNERENMTLAIVWFLMKIKSYFPKINILKLILFFIYLS